jgi:hypothetical protein
LNFDFDFTGRPSAYPRAGGKYVEENVDIAPASGSTARETVLAPQHDRLRQSQGAQGTANQTREGYGKQPASSDSSPQGQLICAGCKFRDSNGSICFGQFVDRGSRRCLHRRPAPGQTSQTLPASSAPWCSSPPSVSLTLGKRAQREPCEVAGCASRRVAVARLEKTRLH